MLEYQLGLLQADLTLLEERAENENVLIPLGADAIVKGMSRSALTLEYGVLRCALRWRG